MRSQFIWLSAAALLASGLTTSRGQAAMIVDDFESYASEAAFDTAWFPTTASHAPIVPATLDTAVAYTGSKSLALITIRALASFLVNSATIFLRRTGRISANLNSDIWDRKPIRKK